ncbi:hypothetical protein J6590_101785 [Homalodisca vitripennis]|nr:hypothetical protein J6590_086702 [Homalodisca vitripennis]KAG8318959.1 hypothetical protein J6590_101785 [Homalodisca vitripennis]
MRGGRSDPSTARRVFKKQLLEFLRDLRSGAMFECPSYIAYVFELQMRGLPHPLIVFKIHGDGPVQADEIDSVIRAEIPSEEEAGARVRKLLFSTRSTVLVAQIIALTSCAGTLWRGPARSFTLSLHAKLSTRKPYNPWSDFKNIWVSKNCSQTIQEECE